VGEDGKDNLMIKLKALYQTSVIVSSLSTALTPVSLAENSAERTIAQKLIDVASYRWAWLEYWQRERPERVVPSSSGTKVTLRIVQDASSLAFCADKLKYCSLYVYGIDGLFFKGDWCNTCVPPTGSESSRKLHATNTPVDLTVRRPLPTDRATLRASTSERIFNTEVIIPKFSAQTYLDSARVSDQQVAIIKEALLDSVASYHRPQCQTGHIEFARPGNYDTILYSYVDLGQGCEKGILVLTRSSLGGWIHDSFTPNRNDVAYFRPLINQAGAIKVDITK